jgi:TetR/AcrR family transcriptional regulator, transcriptional repressor for nem operon
VPRPQNPEIRRRLLAAGEQLIHKNGFNGCGVQEITAAAGIPKGSFYNYFETKEAFAIAVLEAYWSSINERFSGILRDTRSKPLDRVRRYFKWMSEAKEQQRFTLGCLIGNLSLELSDLSPESRRTLSGLFRRGETLLAECLCEAQADKSLPSDRDVHELAAVLIEAWEGAVMRSKVDRKAKAYKRFESLVLESLLN